MNALIAATALLAASLTPALAEDTAETPFSRLGVEWQLAELGGAPFEGGSTIVFPEEGRVAGRALCNRFMGTASWSPDALTLGPLGMTMMACQDGAGERRVVDALGAVVAGGIVGERLVLTLRDGGEMVYIVPAP